MSNGDSNYLKPKSIEKIINGDANELNNYADILGKRFKEEKDVDERGKKRTEKELSTSQIRNILDEIQRMSEKEFNPTLLQLLRPKLAYAAGRHKGRLKEFREVLEEAIKHVKSNEQFKWFKYFVEAIVAYHRYHGGE